MPSEMPSLQQVLSEQQALVLHVASSGGLLHVSGEEAAPLF